MRDYGFEELERRAHCGQWSFDDLLRWYYLLDKENQKHKEQLKLFLYLLIRENLPSGAVAALVSEVEKCASANLDTIFTAKGIADYASELAARILRDFEDENA
jgi:hypothetical protein